MRDYTVATASIPVPLRQQLMGMGKTGTQERCRGFNPFICHEAIGGPAPAALCRLWGWLYADTQRSRPEGSVQPPQPRHNVASPGLPPLTLRAGMGSSDPGKPRMQSCLRLGQRFKHTHGIYTPMQPSVPVDTHSVAGRDRLAQHPTVTPPVMAGRGLQRCFQHIPVWGCRRQQHPLPGLALALCVCPCPRLSTAVVTPNSCAHIQLEEKLFEPLCEPKDGRIWPMRMLSAGLA